MMDYLRFLHPRYANAHKLRERVERRVPRVVVAILNKFPIISSSSGIQFVGKWLRAMQDAIPPSGKIEKFLKDHLPDVLLVTPLTNFASDQVEYIKCAKKLGLRTGLCVHSWDNLSNKGLIRAEPDVVLVWNEIQRSEAVELHGIPRQKVVTTGAQCFDQWFERGPKTGKQEFCRKVGLKPDRPFLLYLCSSPFVAENEVQFVDGWIGQIRSSGDPRLRDVGILIRLHPQNAAQWENVSFPHYENVAIYPRKGSNPVDEDSRAEYFDSMFHSAGVVGLNTSAMIEAGILGRPVYSILTPEFRGSQEGTLHFHYLVDGGLVQVSRGWDESLEELAKAVSDEVDTEKIRRFVKSFVRPHGIDVPCAPILADAIEDLSRREPIGQRSEAPRIRLPRILLCPFSLLAWAARWAVILKLKMKKLYHIRNFASKNLRRLMRLLPILKTLYMHFHPFFLVKKMAWITRGSAPVIVGPWLSEVGFELLYWIPFLNWAKDRFALDPERLIIVSRGGVNQWYKNIGAHYVELFDHFSEEEFRTRNLERIKHLKGQKHTRVSEFDRKIIRLVEKKLNQKRMRVLHPSLMYNLYHAFWKRQRPVSFVEGYSKFKPLPPMKHASIQDSLPKDYVAVKFYFSNCFPDTEENRAFMRNLLAELSAKWNVVLLSTGLKVDEHLDWEFQRAQNIYTIEHLIEPRNNLAVQTNAIRRARIFIGTYGGFSYLAPFYGVPSVAFYSDENGFLPMHLEVARRAVISFDGASLIALNTRDVNILRMMMSP
ncbi:MAG: hypothetical protein ACE5JS_14805 [Nitrospinota bacterium]